MKTIPSNDIDSILVVRLGAIGDVLRVCPAVRRLRETFPNAKIAWAIEHWVQPVVAHSRDVDQFHILDRREIRGGRIRAFREIRRFMKEIRSQKYQVAIDFHRRFKSGLVTRGSGAPYRLGYVRGQETEMNHFFTNVQVRLDDPMENRVLRFLHLIEPLGAGTEYDPDQTGIVIPDEEAVRAAKWYESEGSPPLAAYPGCSKSQAAYHRWPKEKWIELLNRITDSGTDVVLFWGPDELELTQEIADATGERCRMAPNTSLVEMMAMVGQFKAFIGSNTAAMHMAWLQGVPTTMFTVSDPKTDEPLPCVPSRSLRASDYIQADTSKRLQSDVVGQVSVDEAYEAITSLLEETCKQEVKRTSNS